MNKRVKHPPLYLSTVLSLQVLWSVGSDKIHEDMRAGWRAWILSSANERAMMVEAARRQMCSARPLRAPSMCSAGRCWIAGGRSLGWDFWQKQHGWDLKVLVGGAWARLAAEEHGHDAVVISLLIS
jgi:hypothetical protein